MYDDAFTLSIGREEAERILSEIEAGEIDLISINDENYIILAVDVDNGALELEYIDRPISYH